MIGHDHRVHKRLYASKDAVQVRRSAGLGTLLDVGFVVRAALLAACLTALTCTSSTSDCTCVVEYNGERRTLACGETACVGGVVTACGDQNKAVQHGACSEPSPNLDAGAPGSDAEAPPDHSCDDLRTFCSASCNSPASVAADCQATATSGDPQTCAAWQSSNGVVCRP
jgi:hypothetical protein